MLRCLTILTAATLFCALGHGQLWAQAGLRATLEKLDINQDGKIEPDELVVCLVSGNGLKDIATARSAVGQPQFIDLSLDAVKAAVFDNRPAPMHRQTESDGHR